MSLLDLPLSVTLFSNLWGYEATQETLSLRAIGSRIQSTKAAEKEALPLIKLATFGDTRTDKGSLRNDANVVAITGIEADYDAEQMSVGDACQRLREAGLAAIVYTSPSHTPDAPRWRVLCPLSVPLPPERRYNLCARLNGALGAVLAYESFTLSQSYYYGSINSCPDFRVELTEGEAIDLAGHLDATAIGKSGEITGGKEEAPIPLTSSLGLAADPLDIGAALSVIPNDGPAGWVAWNETAMAVSAATGGTELGFQFFNGWSARNASYDADVTRERWDHLRTSPPTTIGAGTIFHMAREACPGWRKPSDLRKSALDYRAKGGLRLLSPSECAESAQRGYVIKGVIAPGDLAIVFGPPGGGKSVLCPHLGYAVAQGRPVFGRRTKQGGVFYVAAEDPHGMRQRVRGLLCQHGDASGFKLVEGVSDLFGVSGLDAAALRDLVEEIRPALVIIDTLAAAAPGLRENESEDMGRVVAFVRTITALGPAVVLAHHSPKGDDSTPRGHGILNGAADVALRLVRDADSGTIQAKATKNRNGACDAVLSFRIESKTLGIDEDGEAITAPLALEVVGAVARKKKLSPSEQATLKVLETLALDCGPKIEEAKWREACCADRRVSVSEKPKDRRDRFRTIFGSLIQKGLVKSGGGMVWIDGGENFDALPAWAATVDRSLHSLMQ